MTSLKIIWDCMFAPKLIKIYGNGAVEKVYRPSPLENWSEKVINSLYVMWNFSIYTSPAIIGYLYHKGYFEPEGLVTLTKFVTSVGVILVISYCFRGIGRYNNPTYTKFLTTLKQAEKNMTPIVKHELNLYDFDFYAWPVEYHNNESIISSTSAASLTPSHHNLMEYLMNIPYKIIAYMAIHTFGIRLMYPGTIAIFQMIIEQNLSQGRSKLVDLYRGERFKIKTGDNNEIDTMFINRRNSSTNGNILVICCEGNAGFYEIGITITPIEAGYSVLGWNHPGFGGSTGTPYPSQEQNALNSVIQFAINKLNFKLDNIILFGWSIGGYSSSWAAMNYPEIKGVILDASFDDVLPLALNHMPKLWEPIVKLAIREHLNLNVVENLCKYPGPVLIIRRTEDEVICTKEGDLSSNRGNYLLMKLFQYRYPCIFDNTVLETIFDYLTVDPTTQSEYFRRFEVDEDFCQSLLQSYVSEYSKSYPMTLGEAMNTQEKTRIALFLVKKYLIDFKSSHCTSLPIEKFQMPWDVNIESDFVFT